MNGLELIIDILGLAMTPILFNRFPSLSKTSEANSSKLSLSVIIPARNEASSLPLLLDDLKHQTVQPLEIIVADDGSTDRTSHLASSFGATVLTLSNKPESWIGKSWACQKGAEAASGRLLLFVDADVRLKEDGIARLLASFDKDTLSVMPWHETQKSFEQFSLLFNLIQAAGNGTTLPVQKCSGLYGPVILMTREIYEDIAGHESVHQSIIEDVALGQQLKSRGYSFKVCVGDPSIRYRMYAGGIKDLLEGWTKNIAWGAAAAPFWQFVLVFIWMTSLISVPLNLATYAVSQNIAGVVTYGAFYLLWVIVLRYVSNKLGKFQVWAVICYPLIMVVTLLVFFLSAIKKIFGLKVRWKDRTIQESKL